MIRPVKLDSVYTSIPIDNIRVADHVPQDEASRLKRLAVSAQVKLTRWYPPMQKGLRPIHAEPERALADAYSKRRTRIYRAPRMPESLELDDPSVMLGTLAVEGPFSAYVEKAEKNRFQWDLRHLNDPNYTLHDGLESIGVRVMFDVDRESKSLRATEIRTADSTFKPNDTGWSRAARLALCAVSTDTTLVRHFNWLHLVACSAFAIATRNQLPHGHPLRRLLWPHMFRTQYSNDMIVEVLLSVGGDLENIFSFTAAGLASLYAGTCSRYHIITANPQRDAARRGIRNAGFSTPSQDNLEALFDVMLKHATRYVEAYYKNDKAVQGDVDVRFWLGEMDELFPNGIGTILGGKPTRNSLAEFCATLIHLVTVHHETLGTNLWDYQLWTHVIPCRVYDDEQRVPVDVYQRLVNANFNLNIHRAKLMRDFTYLAVDQNGKKLFQQFRNELEELNRRMRQVPEVPWQIYPDVLEANVNA